jgi:spermidine synthase
VKVRLLVLIVGAASLAGQVCWSRLAATGVGGTFAAWAVTLFGSMTGLSIGAALAGMKRFRPGAVLGAAALTLMTMPFLILQAARLEGMPTTRGILTATLLCAAHLPFGAFLPTLVASRAIEGKSVGRLVAIGSLGAVLGALAAGDFLAGVMALDHLGILLGVLVAAGIALVGRPAAEAQRTSGAREPLPLPLVLAAFALGVLGLGSESLWMRILGFYWESNTLCFALVTASTVAGLSLGAWIAARLSLPVALGATAVALAGAASLSPLAVHAFGIPARLCLALLLVGTPAAMSGATFILLLGRMKGGAGRALGFLSGANSAGAAAGPLVLLAGGPWITWPSQLLLLIAAGYAALLGAFVGRRTALTAAGLAAALGLWAWTTSTGPVITDYHATVRAGSEFDTVTLPYLRPSLESTVAVTRETRTGTEIVWIDRGFQGDTSPLGRRIPERLGRLPCELLGRAPRNAMVIGLGTGVTLRAIVDSGASTVEVAELSRGVIDANRTILAHLNGGVLGQPAVRVRHGDGRPLLLDAKDPYDLIVTDMIFPTVLGAGNLFSREFYDLARRRLTPDGLFVHWLPCFLLSPEDLSAVLGSFIDTFPQGSAWIGYLGPDRLILGLAGGTISGNGSGAFALGSEDLRRLAGDASRIRDADPRLETRSRESGHGTFGLKNLKRIMERMERRADLATRAWLSFARGELVEAARLAPGTTDAEFQLAGLALERDLAAARRAAESHDSDRMIASLRKAATRESWSAGNLYLADALVASGRYQEAAVELKKAVAKSPRSADARLKLAVLAGELGDRATAKREFDTASALRRTYR